MKAQAIPTTFRYLFSAALALSLATGSRAQSAGEENDLVAEADPILQQVEALGWERSGTGDLGKWAGVEIPNGFRFTGTSGTKGFLELTGNLPGGGELGIIAPEDFDWWVLFEFDESGYVKDEEKDELDADKMLKAMQKNQKAANEYRKEAGLDSLEVLRWAQEPNYNETTNNLEWASVLVDEEGIENVNYNTRLLGRRGVMQVTLICDEAQLPEVLPNFQAMVGGFEYKKGQSYAEFKEGDKIAKYGLAALIVGGGAALAAKAGLFAVIGKFFAKFFKLIIAGVVAIGIGIKRLFSGRSEA